MHTRRLLAAILCAVMTLSLFPALSVTAEAAETDGMHLVYEVDFSGTDGIFEPAGISGKHSLYTYTANGSALSVKGAAYSGSGTGDEAYAFWGGYVKGLTADPDSRYVITYKARNRSAKASSGVGIGSWIASSTDASSVWNVSATYNSQKASALSLQRGFEDVVYATDENRTLLRSADRDTSGFADAQIVYDGPNGAMTFSVKIGGEWQELARRDIDPAADHRVGVVIYTAQTSATYMEFKDMKIYSDKEQYPSASADTSAFTGYAEQPKVITLAEVKPRYGIEEKLSAKNVTAEAIFRNRMDAYWAKIPYSSAASGISLAENFSAAGQESLYVTFRAAIASSDTQLQNALSGIKLQTWNGSAWTDAAVTFTAKKTDDTVVAAADVPTSSNEYVFDNVTTIPVYEFTSSTFAPADVTNIRILPGCSAGSFRLMNLYVWANTGETIRVPELGGNLNPTVTKTTVGSNTEYTLYSTDFSDTHNLVTNIISYGIRSDVTVGGAARKYGFFDLSGNLPTTDGQSVRLYSPDMQLNTALYDKIRVDFTCFRNTAAGDPALNVRLAYSTDNGGTWTSITTKPTVTTVTSGGVDGTGNTTYHVTMDIKSYVPSGAITNVVLMPYFQMPWYDVYAPNGNVDAKPVRTDGPMLGSTGALRMLDFSITGVSSKSNVAAVAAPVYRKDYDSIVIQAMIDEAAAAGKTEVTIPPVNPRNGSDTWDISRVIKVPSDMTLYINNCKLRMADYSLSHMIENKGAGSRCTANEDKNIHIVGVGDAVLQGGVHNGINSFLIWSTGVSTWENIMMLLQNINNFSVENLRIEQSRFWGIVLFYCRNGSVQNMDYFTNREVQKYNGVAIWEQDGIDVRNGCENILVNDVTGRTGDDTVALNAIRPLMYEVYDKSGDIKNITITNIASKLHRNRNNIRVLATNGWKVSDVLIDGVYDTTADFGGYNSWYTVMLGDDSDGYATIAPMEAGDVSNIYLRNLTSATPNPIGVRHPNITQEHWAYEYDSMKNLYSGSAATYLVTEGSAQNGTSTPVTCTHSWTEKLTGTLHLMGLDESAASADWYGCSKCNAVKVPADLPQELDLSSVRLAQNSTYPDRMNVVFPVPAAMTSDVKHSYALTLYANADYTGKIGTVSSESSNSSNLAAGASITKTIVSTKVGGAEIDGFDPADFATLPNGTYYLDASITINGVLYEGKTAVEWTGGTAVLDLSTAALAQNGTYANRMNVKFPIPAALSKGATYGYSATLYAGSDYTGSLGSISSTSSTASKTYAAGDTLQLTMLGSRGDASVGDFTAGDDYTGLPNGTYYLDCSVTINGVTYKGKAPIVWDGYLGVIDLSDATLSLNTWYDDRMNINFPIPTGMASGDTYTYTATLFANSDYTGKIGKVVSNGSTASFDYFPEDTLVLTVLSSNKDADVVIEGYDGSNYTTLPSGTYYAEVTLVIAGSPYAGRGAVSWTQPAENSVSVTYMSDGAVYATDSVTAGTAAAAPNAPSKDGFNFLGWYTADDAAYDFSAPVTEALVLYAKWEEIPAVELIDFAFARMILGNALDMQFAFPKAGVESGAYVEVVRTAADGSKVAQTIAFEDFKSATISGVAHYYVTYSGIAAKEMADTIVATVYDADGVAISNGWTDSVREYALRSLRAANATAKNKTMLVDMLNYGAAAQTYFSYNADDLANKDLTAEELALATTADECVNEVVKGAKNKGSRLILESSIKVQQAFSGLNDQMYATVEFTNYNGRKVSETIAGSAFQIASVSIIELDQVVLADARTIYTLTIYNADGSVYDTHVDSVASYIARASDNALYDAIMNFADSAYNYLKG